MKSTAKQLIGAQAIRQALAQAQDREDIQSLERRKAYNRAILDCSTLTPEELREAAQRAELSLGILDDLLGTARLQGEASAI